MNTLIKIKNLFKNNLLLTFSIVATIALSIYSPLIGLAIINKFLATCKSTIPILILMFALLAFVKIGMDSDKTKNIISSNNNFKGLFMSYAFGLLVSGPIYPGFTLGKTLMEHGLKSRIVIVMLSTWATIKLPLLPFELKILGLKITCVRWFITTIAVFMIAIISNYIIDFINSRSNQEENTIKKF